jgi:hypothetical protein
MHADRKLRFFVEKAVGVFLVLHVAS